MKKGFTLIELLAVIVILAIIAIIATPVILNIIDDSRESSHQRSVDTYLKAVQNTIMAKNMEGEFKPNYCIIEDSELTCNDIALDVVENTKPKYGRILFIDGQIVYYNLNINGKDYKKSMDDNLVPSPKEITGKVLRSDPLLVAFAINSEDEKRLIYSEEDFPHVLLMYGDVVYFWIPDENIAKQLSKALDINVTARQWYYSSVDNYINGSEFLQSLQQYNGHSPIDLNIMSTLDGSYNAYYYIDRVILSFED